MLDKLSNNLSTSSVMCGFNNSLAVSQILRIVAKENLRTSSASDTNPFDNKKGIIIFIIFCPSLTDTLSGSQYLTVTFVNVRQVLNAAIRTLSYKCMHVNGYQN
jgi:hypothetical protein